MKKGTLISLVLLVVLGISLKLTQNLVIEARSGLRTNEKILMLSDRPEVTRIASLGFDTAVADLLWIRAIQYFGGNFSSLDQTIKNEGLINLFENLVVLDPHFTSAWKFGGFIMNESIKDPESAISFLVRGANQNPHFWRLRFEAGFVAFYELQDYDFAKMQLLETVYGRNIASMGTIETQGIPEGFMAESLTDGDLITDAGFDPATGKFLLDTGSDRTIAKVYIDQSSLANQTFQLSYATEEAPTAFQMIPSVTKAMITTIDPQINARYIKIDQMETDDENGYLMLNEIMIYGQANEDVPSYVERMAFEMDRKAGRFKAAWEQYWRYYQEWKSKGDEVNMLIAEQKLQDIYTVKCLEILEEVIDLYQEENDDQLPNHTMFELVTDGYLERILQLKMAEDPNFMKEVLTILLIPDGNIANLLTTFDGSSPHVLITYITDEGKTEWMISPRSDLEGDQDLLLMTIQSGVDKYKDEYGKLPDSLMELTKELWFTGSDAVFEDPLGGEFYLDRETEEVKARNPKY